jgi:hypothetical protein
MKKIQGLVVWAALAIGMAVPASAATTDPEVIIYRFPGVRDDGSGNGVGFATAFYCTSFNGDSNLIRFVTRRSDGSLATNVPFSIQHLETVTALTHFGGGQIGFTLATGLVNGGGTTAIAATSTNIICTAMSFDAALGKPVGVALRGIRFAPVPGSQE